MKHSPPTQRPSSTGRVRPVGPGRELEVIAVRVLERATGRRVQVCDDGSSDGLVDLTLDGPGASAAVEVVADADELYEATLNELYQEDGSFPLVVPLPSSGRQWTVTLSRLARVRVLRRDLGQLLSGLEDLGLVLEDVRDYTRLVAQDDPRVRPLHGRHVVGLCSGPAPEGQVGDARLHIVGIESEVGPHWEDLLVHVEAFLASEDRADVRDKLSRAEAEERHAFVGLTMSSPGPAWFSLAEEYQGLPHRPPRLPAPITHLWVTALPYGRVIRWSPHEGWYDPYRDSPNTSRP